MKKLLVTFLACLATYGTCSAANKIWHIKAINTEGKTLDIKVFYGKDNNQLYDVKAIEKTGSNEHKILHVKVLHKSADTNVHVEIIKGANAIYYVKGVTNKGKVLDIKAITSGGKKLDIEAFPQGNGNFDIKAITENNIKYAVKAISPEGNVYDVKGIKMLHYNNKIKNYSGNHPIQVHIEAIRHGS